jgi:hypothetical protein
MSIYGRIKGLGINWNMINSLNIQSPDQRQLPLKLGLSRHIPGPFPVIQDQNLESAKSI